MKNKILFIIVIIFILFMSFSVIKFKVPKNEKLKNAANHINKDNENNNYTSKYNNENENKLKENINKINELNGQTNNNNNALINNNNQINTNNNANNNINNNINNNNALISDNTQINTNNNINNNVNENNININDNKNVINNQNKDDSGNDDSNEEINEIIKSNDIELATWIFNQLETNNSIINNYFKFNKTIGFALDSTGTNTGVKVNQLMSEKNIDINNLSWKITYLDDGYHLYIAKENIANTSLGSIINVKEFLNNNDYKEIKVSIADKEQQKGIIIHTMNKYIENNNPITNKDIFDKLYLLLFNKGSIINNFFNSYDTLDSTGGNTGINSNKVLKEYLNISNDKNISWKINKLNDKSFDIYVLNNVDISTYNIGETVNDVFKINTKNSNEFINVQMKITNNNNNKCIMEEIK